MIYKLVGKEDRLGCPLVLAGMQFKLVSQADSTLNPPQATLALQLSPVSAKL
jgi:hypothetical protein